MACRLTIFSSVVPLLTLRGALARRISSTANTAPRATPTRLPITIPAMAPLDSPDEDDVVLPPVAARALVTMLVETL